MHRSIKTITTFNCVISGLLLLMTAVSFLSTFTNVYISARIFFWLIMLCLCSIPCAAVFETVGIVFSCILIKREGKYKYIIINAITLIIIAAISIFLLSSIKAVGDGI